MSDTTNQLPPPTIWPCIRYADAFSAIEFLQKAFGFTERLVEPSEDGNDVVHAELRWPLGGGVMVGSTSHVGLDVDVEPGSGFVYVVTDEPDALYDRAIAAGAVEVRGLRDEEFGSRGFTVRDLEGNVWSFGTYPGA
jgi:uncharacterized glyoxalase superfamily protein PhnB